MKVVEDFRGQVAVVTHKNISKWFTATSHLLKNPQSLDAFQLEVARKFYDETDIIEPLGRRLENCELFEWEDVFLKNISE